MIVVSLLAFLILLVEQSFSDYLVTNGLCVTLGGDQQTLQLYRCGDYAYQSWDLSSGDKIQLGGYCLDAFPGPQNGLQIKPCNYGLSQSWWFGADGRITNRAQNLGCLSTSGSIGSFFYLTQCGTSSSIFYSSRTLPQQSSQLPTYNYQQPLPPFPQQSIATSLQQSQYFQPQPAQYLPQQGQIPPLYPPQIPQAPPIQMPPPVQQQPVLPPPPQFQQQQPVFQSPPQIQQQPLPPVQQQPMPPMQQQQLPPLEQSPQLSQQQQMSPQPSSNLPVSQQIQNAVDLSQDHYLCVCIVDSNAESCNEAVRAACMVGHIPAAPCRQSFSKGDHDNIADEILKLIENGAKCSQFDIEALKKEAQQKPQNLPAPVASQGDGTPTEKDHYLCVCLEEDSRSQRCIAAVKSACLVGHIPSGDCYSSLNNKDHDGVTNHILKLIDAGAKCATTLSRTRPPSREKKGSFLSRITGGTPNNKKQDKSLCACLDDHESAQCGNAIKRACELKKIPKEDCDVAKGRGYLGGVTRHLLRLVDHGAECPAHRAMTFTNHGCHCLQTWELEGKQYVFPNNCADPGGKKGFGWCKTFPSEHCAGVDGSIEWDRCDNPKIPIRRDPEEVDGKGSLDGSLGDEDHYLCICLETTSTDEVCVAAVRAACEVGHLPQESCRQSFEKQDHTSVSDSVIQLLKGGAKCKDTLGTRFVKQGSAECIDGYFGYPNCRKKVECEEPCKAGATCDYSDGTCACLPNFTGPTCSQCAEGYSGRNCTPDDEGGGWTLGQGLVYLFLFAGLAYAGFTAYKRYGGGQSHSITYSKLSTPVPPVPESPQDDEITLSSDLGGDIENQSSPPPTKKQQHQHTGLAI